MRSLGELSWSWSWHVAVAWELGGGGALHSAHRRSWWLAGWYWYWYAARHKTATTRTACRQLVVG
jgi:hypothetical protein